MGPIYHHPLCQANISIILCTLIDPSRDGLLSIARNRRSAERHPGAEGGGRRDLLDEETGGGISGRNRGTMQAALLQGINTGHPESVRPSVASIAPIGHKDGFDIIFE
jgi:hypothetical protein